MDCPVVSRAGQNRPAPQPLVRMVNPDEIRMQEERKNRREDTVTQAGQMMTNDEMVVNRNFIDEVLPNAKMVKIWVDSHECKGTYISKKSGIAYDGVLLIGVNGRHYPLLPGNNLVPDFVYDAVETWREMSGRLKNKITPPVSRGMMNMGHGSVAGGTSVHFGVNKKAFQDSMLPSPFMCDAGVNLQASQIMRNHREAALKEMKNR